MYRTDRRRQALAEVFNELRNRGLDDIRIAVVDGLRGFPESIEAVYPQAQIQTCIAHLTCNSTTLAVWKGRKEMATVLKPIYHVANADLAEAALGAFAVGPWSTTSATVAAMWRRQWPQVIPFLAYRRKSTRLSTRPCHRKPAYAPAKDRRDRGHFPSDEAASKLLLVALRNIDKDWNMAQRT